MQAHPLKENGFGYCPTLQKQEKENGQKALISLADSGHKTTVSELSPCITSGL
jgi:hypothetical protein